MNLNIKLKDMNIVKAFNLLNSPGLVVVEMRYAKLWAKEEMNEEFKNSLTTEDRILLTETEKKWNQQEMQKTYSLLLILSAFMLYILIGSHLVNKNLIWCAILFALFGIIWFILLLSKIKNTKNLLKSFDSKWTELFGEGDIEYKKRWNQMLHEQINEAFH